MVYMYGGSSGINPPEKQGDRERGFLPDDRIRVERYPKEKIDRYRSDRLFGTDNDWRTPTAQLTAGARDHREN